MDNDMWLVETEDAGPKHLRSPGATSSGYCSSDDMLASATSTAKRQSNASEQQRPIDTPLPSPGSRLIAGGAGDVSKTNATFDGFADSLWEPLSGSSAADDAQCTGTSATQRHVYHGLIAKQLAPSKKSAAADFAETELRIGQTISVWHRHVASEMGNPFALTADDCGAAYKGSSCVSSGGTSVDVTVSTKGQSGSSKPPTVIVRPVGRARVAAPLVSCGSSVLRRSATVPSRMPLVAGLGVMSQCSTSRCDHLYSHHPQVLHAESTPSIHDALRDHMYALKVSYDPLSRSFCACLSGMVRSQGIYA